MMVEGGGAAVPGSDPIAVIRRALMDSKTQLSNVNSVLTGFKTGLDRLEGQMMPIYNLTEKLRETQKNIDLSVHELRAVNETFATATEVAPRLHQGAKYDQAEYIKAMQRLLQSISFMESHRGYEGCGKALEQARQVLSQAQAKCKADIVNDIGLFARYSMTISPSSASADPADADESDAADERHHLVVTASQPSDTDVAKVKALVQCLLGTGFIPRQLLLEYGEKRLKHIKDFFADKAKAAADMSSAQDSKGSIGRYLDSFVFVIKTEKVLSSKVFPNEDLSHAALSYTIAPLLESLTHDVSGRRPPTAPAPSSMPLSPSAHKSQLKEDVFRTLDLHYLFKDKSAAFKDALQPPLRLREHPGVETADPWKLVGIIGKMEEGLAVTSKQTLAQFKEDIGDSLAQDKLGLRDGNVHPVSSNVMQFLRHLCDHVVELECLLKSDQTTNVAYFIDSIVMKLIDSLKAKATAARGGRDDLRALFTLNNIVYVAQSLKQLGVDLHVQTVVTAALQQTIQPKVAALGDKAMQEFLHLSYDDFDATLADPKSKLQYNRNSDVLTLDSGRLLKEKFTKFNAALDELCLHQTSYTVPDTELRRTLTAAAHQRIVPSYTAFYDKYSIVHFSKKHMDKYVKYTPVKVDAMLHELFQGMHASSHPPTSRMSFST